MNQITRKLTSWREHDTAILAKWLLLPLAIVIAWMSAQLFWQIGGLFTTEQISTTIQNTRSSDGTTKPEQNINSLLGQHIFGDAGKVPVAPVEESTIDEDVPETRLDLKLRGIYASTDEKRSNAIIETAGGEQNLYFIDDIIPGERNLSLARVLIDRVILKRNGKFETLTMEDLSQGIATNLAGSNSKSSSSIRKKKLIDRRNNRQLTKQLSKIKQQMINDPTSLAGLMNVRPKMVNGEFKGFSISPGKDASLFARSGLRRNDVITSVNGIVLDEPSKAISLIEEVRNAQELSIELTRGGNPLSLIYNLNDDNQ